MKYFKTGFVLLTFFYFMPPLHAQKTTIHILGAFEKDWHKNWLKREFGKKPTIYQVVEEDTNRVLRADSEKTASGLWHMLNVRPENQARLSWRWKVDNSLDNDTPQRTKKGDDYAARIYVVFEPHFVSWKTRAICYVWSASEPVGAIFKNPYTASVRHIVVESGKKNKSKWVAEKRNVLADYTKLFGKAPEMITAVAIMVDTDNSHQRATAWFDDIVLEVQPAASDTSKSKAPGVLFEFE
ncbi:MAG: DUF3047 domain-containing protein [bacterium]